MTRVTSSRLREINTDLSTFVKMGITPKHTGLLFQSMPGKKGHHLKDTNYNYKYNNHHRAVPNAPRSIERSTDDQTKPLYLSNSSLGHWNWSGDRVYCLDSTSFSPLCVVGAFFCSISNRLIAFSRSSTPPFRNLVTLWTFRVVSSLRVSRPCARCLATVRAVMANRISFGPSTSSRMALGA